MSVWRSLRISGRAMMSVPDVSDAISAPTLVTSSTHQRNWRRRGRRGGEGPAHDSPSPSSAIRATVRVRRASVSSTIVCRRPIFPFSVSIWPSKLGHSLKQDSPALGRIGRGVEGRVAALSGRLVLEQLGDLRREKPASSRRPLMKRRRSKSVSSYRR